MSFKSTDKLQVVNPDWKWSTNLHITLCLEMHSVHGKWRCRKTSNKEPWHTIQSLNPIHVTTDVQVDSLTCNARVHTSHHGFPHSFECSGMCQKCVTGYVVTLLKGLNIRNWLMVHNTFQMPPQIKCRGFKSGHRAGHTTGHPVLLNLWVKCGTRLVLHRAVATLSVVLPKAHSPAMEAACYAGRPDLFLRSGVVEAELVQVGVANYLFPHTLMLNHCWWDASDIPWGLPVAHKRRLCRLMIPSRPKISSSVKTNEDGNPLMVMGCCKNQRKNLSSGG